MYRSETLPLILEELLFHDDKYDRVLFGSQLWRLDNLMYLLKDTMVVFQLIKHLNMDKRFGTWPKIQFQRKKISNSKKTRISFTNKYLNMSYSLIFRNPFDTIIIITKIGPFSFVKNT